MEAYCEQNIKTKWNLSWKLERGKGETWQILERQRWPLLSNWLRLLLAPLCIKGRQSMCHITGSENQKTIAGLWSKDTILDLPKDLGKVSRLSYLLSLFNASRKIWGQGGKMKFLLRVGWGNGNREEIISILTLLLNQYSDNIYYLLILFWINPICSQLLLLFDDSEKYI